MLLTSYQARGAEDVARIKEKSGGIHRETAVTWSDAWIGQADMLADLHYAGCVEHVLKLHYDP